MEYNMKKLLIILTVFLLTGFSFSPVQAGQNKRITVEEIFAAQKKWGAAIVAIGKAHTENSNYKEIATDAVDKLYGYQSGPVLFKPTKASEVQFRSTREQAISYFVTGIIPEDHGFALQPWSEVYFENTQITIDSDSAMAMGNYFFTDAATGNRSKVEFTFAYFKDRDGNLRINLHHSSLPYRPEN